MALVTHTPGPWTVERIPDEAKRDPELTMDADGAFWIAEACMAGEVLAIVTALPKDADVAEANARLMALAPEMFDALKQATTFMTHTRMCARDLERAEWTCSCGFNAVFDAAAVVIAKVEGR